MSDTNFYGVLKMPFELAMSDELSRRQFYSVVQEAVKRLHTLEQPAQEPVAYDKLTNDEKASIKRQINNAFNDGFEKGKAMSLVASIPPNFIKLESIDKPAPQPAQEPVDVARVQLDGYVEWREGYEDLPVGTKLYTHPAPSQWISVKNRLPEFVDISDFEKSSNDVLILIDGKHIYIGSYIWDSYSQETEFCMRDLDGGYEGVSDMNVTHWMPLPDAPKE